MTAAVRAPLSDGDVERLVDVVGAAARHLDATRQVIDDLNVFPVPDGDTGTNLSLTLRAVDEALRSADRATVVDREQLAALVKRASLMGARGNSGIILSQIVRGLCETLGREAAFDAPAVARALRAAADVAYRAVRKPTEGTMLTVIRELADFAERRVERRGAAEPLEAFLDAVGDEGDRSVARTPSLLAVLADAGVVDSGGYGLVVILRGIVAGLRDEAPAAAPGAGQPTLPTLTLATGEPLPGHAEDEARYQYCTNFLVEAGGDATLDTGAIEADLERLGDSLVVVGDGAQVKVHVHTDHPGRAIEVGAARGVIGGVEVSDMRAQERERTERLSAAGHPDAGRHLHAVAPATATPAAPPVAVRTAVIAVCVGEGNERLFASLGARSIVVGGPSMNPSTADLVAAVEAVGDAEEVVLLPNDGNVVMAAEQAARVANRPVTVVESKSIPAGLAAMVAYNGEMSAADNATAMRAALREVRSGEVTVAVRSVPSGDVPIEKGQWIGLLDGRVVTAADGADEVVGGLVDALLEGGREILTVLRGEESGRLDLDAALADIRRRHPDVEIDDHAGGQPLYPLLLAAE